MRINARAWLLEFPNGWSCIFGIGWWNPFHGIEIRRSFKIDFTHSEDKPLISIVVAFLFLRFEWYLGKSLMYLTEDEEDE